MIIQQAKLPLLRCVLKITALLPLPLHRSIHHTSLVRHGICLLPAAVATALGRALLLVDY
jgi:hypothetical protein